MNKRLRKKKRVGEFTELGFEIYGYWRDDAPPDAAFDAFIDMMITAAEARGLGFGGGGVDPFSFSFAKHRGSATQDDIALFVGLVRDCPLVRAAGATPLHDRWRCSEERMDAAERAVLAQLV